jgi:hypothetical protein
MIRWCAYCRTYLDEIAPVDDFGISHSLRAAAAVGDVARAGEMLDQGLSIGLRPVDLALGMLQPLLHRIGAEWALGRATGAEEHRFTAFCTA